MNDILTISDIAEYLDYVGLQYMATIGLDGKPKVRPVQYMVLHSGKIWFCTNSRKSMYAELQNCPYIEICGSRLQDNEMATVWIRFQAEAVFSDDRAVKEAIMKKSTIVHELYQDNPDHPLLKVFYLRNITGSLNNLGHIQGLPVRNDFAKPVEFSL